VENQIKEGLADMGGLFAIITYPALLAQYEDDYPSRLCIIIGILAFPCLVIFAIVRQKLKDADESDKHIEKLQRRVTELEQATPTKQPVVKAPNLAELSRAFRIVHVDEEIEFSALVSSEIDRQFKNVIVVGFRNFDEAWEELQQADPDLLILDKNGYELLRLLAQRKVKYPILVLSSSLTNEVFDLSVSFLKKPFGFGEWGHDVNKWTKEQLCAELSKYIKH
jgi:hypothetical protein